MRRDEAETVALKALGWIIGAEDQRDGFMAVSGLAPEDLMRRAGEPEVLLAVMDFLLAEDRRVIAFCDAAGQRCDTLATVRAALPGGEEVHWT
ncbi:MAG: DUF3572 domain-containing protein [Proteobacteria bacterium]|nr:DUF3572 domain-containing protein [Pseudomonadota bacterium]